MPCSTRAYTLTRMNVHDQKLPCQDTRIVAVLERVQWLLSPVVLLSVSKFVKDDDANNDDVVVVVVDYAPASTLH